MVDRLFGIIKEVLVDTNSPDNYFNYGVKFDILGDNESNNYLEPLPTAYPMFRVSRIPRVGEKIVVYFNYEAKDGFLYMPLSQDDFIGMVGDATTINMRSGENKDSIDINTVKEGSEIHLNGKTSHLVKFEELIRCLSDFYDKICEAIEKAFEGIGIGTAASGPNGKAMWMVNKPVLVIEDFEKAKCNSVLTSGEATIDEDARNVMPEKAFSDKPVDAAATIESEEKPEGSEANSSTPDKTTEPARKPGWNKTK